MSLSNTGPQDDTETSGSASIETQTQEKHLFTDEMKFMQNFDPNQRSIAKKMKKFSNSGIIVEKCDCLISKCTGCHLPCESCGSRLCGHECRRGRLWEYEEIEVQGGPTIEKRKK